MQQNNSKKIAKVEVRIPPEVKESFAVKCETQGKTVSETVRDFIHQHINSDNLHKKNSENTTNNLNIIRSKNTSILLTLAIAVVATSSIVINSGTSNSLPDPKIINIFNKYDRNHDGLLTFDDFEEFKKHQIKRIQEGKSQLISKLPTEKKTFSMMTIEEFNHRYSSTEILAKYDLNLDGEVNINEFIQSKPRLNYITWASFNLLDINSDNILTRDELLNYANKWFDGYPLAKKRAKLSTKTRLWKLDHNEDGEISYKEFKRYKVN